MPAAPKNVQQKSNAAFILVFAVIGAVGAHVLHWPAIVVLWVGAIAAAWAEPPAMLTGKRDAAGRPTPATPKESQLLQRWSMANALRFSLIFPGRALLPGWPVLYSWVLAVLAAASAATLATTVPFGRAANAYAAFALVSQIAMIRREFGGAPVPHPGTRVSSLGAWFSDGLKPKLLLAAAVLLGLLVGTFAVYPRYVTEPLARMVGFPAYITDRWFPWLSTPIPGAIFIIAAFVAWAVIGRDLSSTALQDWRTAVDAHHEWQPRWAGQKVDPAPRLLSRRQLGQMLVDEFQLDPNSGWSTMSIIGITAKLASTVGPGTQMAILYVPDTDSQGQPMPGTAHATKFRIVRWPADNPVNITDPTLDLELAEMWANASFAQVALMTGAARPVVVDMTDISHQQPPEEAGPTLKERIVAGLRRQVSWRRKKDAATDGGEAVEGQPPNDLVPVPQGDPGEDADATQDAQPQPDQDPTPKRSWKERFGFGSRGHRDGSTTAPPPDAPAGDGGEESEFSPTRAWRSQLAFPGPFEHIMEYYRGLTGNVATAMQCEVLINHRNEGVVYFGALGEPTIFTDPGDETQIQNIRNEDEWIARWSGVLKMGQQAPTIQPATEMHETVQVDGRPVTVHHVAFLVRQGVDPRTFFGLESGLATTLSSALVCSVTGYPAPNQPQGSRHPTALTVLWSNDNVPPDIRRLPAGKASQWILASRINRAFSSARLMRPEIGSVRTLVPAPHAQRAGFGGEGMERGARGRRGRGRPERDGARRGAATVTPKGQIWEMVVWLHDGTTYADVKGALGKITQSLAPAPWVRITPHERGVIIYAGDKPRDVAGLSDRDQFLVTELDWSSAMASAGVTGDGGVTPKLISEGALPRNENVQRLLFDMPPGTDRATVQKGLEKLKSATGRGFVEIRANDFASQLELLVADSEPIPTRAPFDFAEVDASSAIPFATSIEGEPTVYDWNLDPHLMVLGLSGGGKAQPLDEVLQVPRSPKFPDGWAAFGDLERGDLVFSSTGHAISVLDVSETRQRDEFRLTLADGSSTRCSDDHLWPVTVPVSLAGDAGVLIRELSWTYSADALRRSASAIMTTAMRMRGQSTAPIESLVDAYGHAFDAHELKVAAGAIVRSDVPAERVLPDAREVLYLASGLRLAAARMADGDDDVAVSRVVTTTELVDLLEVARSSGAEVIVERFDAAAQRLRAIPVASVERTGEESEMRCILVDSVDHCYLTANGIVTHNTVLAQGLVYGALMRGAEVYVIDPMKGAADYQFAKTRCSGMAVTIPDSVALVKYLYAEVRRRVALNQQYGTPNIDALPEDVRPPHIVVFIDEFTSLLLGEKPNPTKMDDPALEAERLQAVAEYQQRLEIGLFTGKFSREARSAGLTLVLITQKLTAKDLDRIQGGNSLRNNMSRILLGKAGWPDKASALREPESVPDYTPSEFPRGRAIWEPSSSSPTYVQVWYAPADELQRELESRRPEAQQVDFSGYLPKDPTAGGVEGEVIEVVDAPAAPVDSEIGVLEFSLDDLDDLDAPAGDTGVDAGLLAGIEIIGGDLAEVAPADEAAGGAAPADDGELDWSSVTGPPADDVSEPDWGSAGLGGAPVEGPTSAADAADSWTPDDISDAAATPVADVDPPDSGDSGDLGEQVAVVAAAPDPFDTPVFDESDEDEPPTHAPPTSPVGPGDAASGGVLTVSPGPAGAVMLSSPAGRAPVFPYMVPEPKFGWWVIDAVMNVVAVTPIGSVVVEVPGLDEVNPAGISYGAILVDALASAGIRDVSGPGSSSSPAASSAPAVDAPAPAESVPQMDSVDDLDVADPFADEGEDLFSDAGVTAPAADPLPRSESVPPAPSPIAVPAAAAQSDEEGDDPFSFEAARRPIPSAAPIPASSVAASADDEDDLFG